MQRHLVGFLATVIASMASANDYFPIDVDVNQWRGTPLDFSYLNKRLDSSDRIAVNGADFYRIGADGKVGTKDDQPIKFFGVNLAFSANFPDQAQADLLVARLSTLGVNIVRLHHMDTQFTVDGKASKDGILHEGKFPSFDAESVSRLKYLIAKLADAGIYVDLNLHVSYTFNALRDELTSVPADFQFPPRSSPYHMLLPELIKRQQDYACGLIQRLELKQSPALAMLEINNESSLIDAWQFGLLEPNDINGNLMGLRASWQQFQRQKSWSPEVDMVSFRQTSKVGQKAKYAEFLASLDKAYLDTMKTAVKACAGEQVPVTGTQMAYGGLANQRSHDGMDFLDTHFYIDHYKFPAGWRQDNWWIKNNSLALDKFYPLASISLLRQQNKPFTVSEFNQAWPNRFGQEIDITTAAFALVQGWDGLMHFNYSNDDNYADRVPKGFNLHGDPARLAAFGQTARFFRQFSVSPSRVHVVFDDSDAYKFAAADVKQSEMMGAVKKAFNLKQDVLLNSRVSSSIAAQRGVERQSGQSSNAIRFASAERRLYVQAPDIWALSGQVTKGALGTDSFRLTYPGGGPDAALAVLTSIDGKAINQTGRLLLTVPGAVWRSLPVVKAAVKGQEAEPEPEQFISYRDGWTLKPQGKTPSALLQSGEGPLWMERQPMTVSVKLKSGSWHVYPLNGMGKRLDALPKEMVTFGDTGVVGIDMTSEAARVSPWYELVLDK